MLVEARYGKGRWIYIGLGCSGSFRAGVPSAYKLFANLPRLGSATARVAEMRRRRTAESDSSA
jgi:hypothetical protein